jgi:hypothetical protein
MKYSDILQKLTKLGITQVTKEHIGGYSVVRIAKSAEVCFPFAFTSFRLILDQGTDTEIDEEIIDAILRRFGKTREEFDSPN